MDDLLGDTTPADPVPDVQTTAVVLRHPDAGEHVVRYRADEEVPAAIERAIDEAVRVRGGDRGRWTVFGPAQEATTP